MQKPRCILMDIEGTTSSVTFVHDVLFPYAAKKLDEFVKINIHTKEVADQLEKAVSLASQEGSPHAGQHNIVEILLDWIRLDKKHPPLKALQGMIWKKGYEEGEFTSHIYEEVPECWKAWIKAGISLAIYSSGSVPAQKLLFGHTSRGDLRPCLSRYFDTGAGPKQSSDSYITISQELDLAPPDILFLSDVVEELQAAKEAGMNAVHILRPGTLDRGFTPTATNFRELSFS